jgi:hypothetical protein
MLVVDEILAVAVAVVDGLPKFRLLPPANCSLPPLEIKPLPTVEP